MTITETRAKVTEESVKKLEQQLQNYMTETNQKLETNETKMDVLGHKMDVMMEKLFINKDGLLGSAPVEIHDFGSGRARGKDLHENSGGKFHMNRNKVDCPYFEEGDPRSWLRKCESYFHYNGILDPQHKLETAVLHLNGRAESCYFSYQLSRGVVIWADFVEEICKRFNNSDNSNLNLLGKFKRIEQIGTVNEYLEKFEDLKAWVLIKHPTIPEEFFLGFFIESLKEETRHTVKMLDPYSLSQAVEKARHKEELLDSMNREGKLGGSRPGNQYNTNFSTGGVKNSGIGQKEGNYNSSTPGNKLFEARKARGECYKCGERYFPGHVCKNRQINTLSGTTEQEEVVEGSNLEEIKELEEPYEEVIDEAISLNALSGTVTSNTIKLKGMYGKQGLIILADNGSTHSFVASDNAKQLGCVIREAAPMRVTAANGSHLMSYHYCPLFKWKVHGVEFDYKLRLLDIGGCDIVLGGDWMRKHNPILFDFIGYRLQVSVNGKRVDLKGYTEEGSLQAMSALGVKQLLKKGQVLWAHLFTLTAKEERVTEAISEEIKSVLEEFARVFAEPKALPPRRKQDHFIPLKPEAVPVSIRPYRYNYFSKNEIEKQVNEMLSSGTIQPSHSPFSSPVLLVKKKDGSWRFCINYRELNKMTIKDKFPIPLVDDLMDELHGACIYSKIDLRAGYHQIRMGEADIYKTALRTHLGHYEFKVMPFGLTNAPATFQSLMNHIFKPFLRKFVLVFFDDILVYSSSLEVHALHLRKVLEVLCKEKLYAKLSKFSFGQDKVEYLGHIISGRGVATDPSKIEAMINWPIPKSVKALRGFLGLTGYYRRFVKSYGVISRPLTNLLKKNSFQWSTEAEEAFQQLKQAMSTVPVLALADFNKPFIIETDACATGMGAVLMQGGRPIAYFSKALALKHRGLSTYEKEYLAVLSSIEKWRHYLQGGHFIVKTDHQSLKYLLEQKVNTALQQKGLTKLLGLDYEVQYKKGEENKVADAFSRRQEEDSTLLAISIAQATWLQEVSQSYENDPIALQIVSD
ncbi:PREDICTED: uncharacterized protein LOC109226149 [Nicotiana attenuata]|uniref:uncharacterized protein LOC109226149 n=1 Tax=Nicotiana attenuata TaxID=49451 RepID=UPI000905CDCF|nr:PREDICTED: uncharacterized protein LOC109226149 [Nicotiana attenuata]